MSRECPSLTSFFNAWIDVQDLAFEKSDAPKGMPPSLSNTIKALKIKDWHDQRHRASHDAVRCLAVLSGLHTLKSFTTFALPPKVRLRSKLPSPRCSQPFSVRITAVDGSMLPKIPTSGALSKYFAKYQPKDVALNRSGFVKNDGVRVWWMSFFSLDGSLHRSRRRF